MQLFIKRQRFSATNLYFFHLPHWQDKNQRLKGENQWQYKNHHDSHNDLQRQSYFYIIHKSILSGRHHQGIRRCRKRRSKTHTCTYRHGKQERNRTDSNLYGTLQSNRSKQNSGSRITNKHRHQRSRKINTCHQCNWSVWSQTVHQCIGNILNSFKNTHLNIL